MTILIGNHRWQFKSFQILLLTIIIIVSSITVDTIRIVRYFHNQQHQQPDVEFIQAIIGHNLTLYCKIILETNDQLYSLKWYRQLNGTYQEFFSYSKLFISILAYPSSLPYLTNTPTTEHFSSWILISIAQWYYQFILLIN